MTPTSCRLKMFQLCLLLFVGTRGTSAAPAAKSTAFEEPFSSDELLQLRQQTGLRPNASTPAADDESYLDKMRRLTVRNRSPVRRIDHVDHAESEEDQRDANRAEAPGSNDNRRGPPRKNKKKTKTTPPVPVRRAAGDSFRQLLEQAPAVSFLPFLERRDPLVNTGAFPGYLEHKNESRPRCYQALSALLNPTSSGGPSVEVYRKGSLVFVRQFQKSGSPRPRKPGSRGTSSPKKGRAQEKGRGSAMFRSMGGFSANREDVLAQQEGDSGARHDHDSNRRSELKRKTHTQDHAGAENDPMITSDAAASPTARALQIVTEAASISTVGSRVDGDAGSGRFRRPRERTESTGGSSEDGEDLLSEIPARGHPKKFARVSDCDSDASTHSSVLSNSWTPPRPRRFSLSRGGSTALAPGGSCGCAAGICSLSSHSAKGWLHPRPTDICPERPDRLHRKREFLCPSETDRSEALPEEDDRSRSPRPSSASVRSSSARGPSKDLPSDCDVSSEGPTLPAKSDLQRVSWSPAASSQQSRDHHAGCARFSPGVSMDLELLQPGEETGQKIPVSQELAFGPRTLVEDKTAIVLSSPPDKEGMRVPVSDADLAFPLLAEQRRAAGLGGLKKRPRLITTQEGVVGDDEDDLAGMLLRLAVKDVKGGDASAAGTPSGQSFHSTWAETACRTARDLTLQKKKAEAMPIALAAVGQGHPCGDGGAGVEGETSAHSVDHIEEVETATAREVGAAAAPFVPSVGPSCGTSCGGPARGVASERQDKEERRGVEKQDRRDPLHEAEADRPEQEFVYVQVDDEAAPFDAAAFLAKSGCGTFFQVLVEGSAEHYSFTRDLVIQYRLCDFEEDADVEADSSSSGQRGAGAAELTKLLFPSSGAAWSGRLNDIRKKLCRAMTPAEPSLNLLLILIRRALREEQNARHENISGPGIKSGTGPASGPRAQAAASPRATASSAALPVPGGPALPLRPGGDGATSAPAAATSVSVFLSQHSPRPTPAPKPGAESDHEKPGAAPGVSAQFVRSAFSVQSFRRSLWFLVRRFMESGEAFAEAVRTRQAELALLATYLTSSRWLKTEEERRAVWRLPALLQLRLQGLPLWLAHLQDGAALVSRAGGEREFIIRADGTENSEPQRERGLPKFPHDPQQKSRMLLPLSREQQKELQHRTAAYLWRQIRRVLSPLYMTPDSDRRRPDTTRWTASSRAGNSPVYFTDVPTGDYQDLPPSRSSIREATLFYFYLHGRKSLFRAKVASLYFGLSFQFTAGYPPREDETAAEVAAETQVHFGIERFASSWHGAKLLVGQDLVTRQRDGVIVQTLEYTAAHPDRVASGQFATGFFTDEGIEDYCAPSERDGREGQGNITVIPWEMPWQRAIQSLREQRKQEQQRRQLEARSRMRVSVLQVSDRAEAACRLADPNTYFPIPPPETEPAGQTPGFVGPGLEVSRHILAGPENGPPQNLLAPNDQQSYQGLPGVVFLAQPTDPAPTPEPRLPPLTSSSRSAADHDDQPRVEVEDVGETRRHAGNNTCAEASTSASSCDQQTKVQHPYPFFTQASAQLRDSRAVFSLLRERLNPVAPRPRGRNPLPEIVARHRDVFGDRPPVARGIGHVVPDWVQARFWDDVRHRLESDPALNTEFRELAADVSGFNARAQKLDVWYLTTYQMCFGLLFDQLEHAKADVVRKRRELQADLEEEAEKRRERLRRGGLLVEGDEEGDHLALLVEEVFGWTRDELAQMEYEEYRRETKNFLQLGINFCNHLNPTLAVFEKGSLKQLLEFFQLPQSFVTFD